MLIYALCRQLTQIAFTRFLSWNPPECQDWGAGRGGQANLGNARIFTVFVTATPHKDTAFSNGILQLTFFTDIRCVACWQVHLYNAGSSELCLAVQFWIVSSFYWSYLLLSLAFLVLTLSTFNPDYALQGLRNCLLAELLERGLHPEIKFLCCKQKIRWGPKNRAASREVGTLAPLRINLSYWPFASVVS